MAPSKHPLARLEHVRDEIVQLRAVMADQTATSFAGSYVLRRTAEHAILIISEAVRALPRELTDRYPGPPWPEIRGIGNVLRHEYFSVESPVLWNIVSIDLPPLAIAVEAMIGELRG